MASKLKPPATTPAKNCRHSESQSQTRPEVGTQAGTAEPNPAVVTVLTLEAEVWAQCRGEFVRAQTPARLIALDR